MVVEGEKPVFTHERLVKVYGEAAVAVKTVRRWVRRIKEAETGAEVHDKRQSGRLCSAVKPNNMRRIAELAATVA